MEAALVTVGTGVMKPILSKLYKLMKEEYSKLKGVHSQVKEAREEMRSMEAALEALAETEKLEPSTAVWRDDVRELSYDMEDCIDDFIARADTKKDGPKGFMGFFDKLKKLKSRHQIAGDFKKLKARVTEASKKHNRYKLDCSIPDSGTCDIDPRLHMLYAEVGKLVGIDGPKKHLIEWLKNEHSSTQLRVVSIVGAGGLGKTTLANAVYKTIRSEFACGAFVSVSRKLDMKNLLIEIAQRLGIPDITSNHGEHLLIDTLRQHLQDKKYLVVVDDIWSTEACEAIRDALPSNDHGSRIITTTRNSTVASSQGDYVYRMQRLSATDSRRLFIERAFGSEDLFPPNLEEVSGKILEKCAGLPLAIITLSSFLTNKPAEEEWNKVLDYIGSSLANKPDAGKMKTILSLSYFDLPHPMRTCLLYLSAYPEDHIIEKQSLIHKWMAEGFICEEQGRSAYEVGEHYFNDFINRSLIQAADIYNEEEEEEEDYGQVLACRVHDIILDFITCKAAEENFMTSFDDVGPEHMKWHKVRRLSVSRSLTCSNHSHKMADVSADLSHVRTLAIFGDSSLDSPIIREMDFLLLRVLDLGECWHLKNDHLANIEKFLLLKYLRLPGSITEIPGGIGKLKYLETLDMHGVELSKLPSSMTRLQRLARLYANLQPSCLLDGIIGQLQSLEELAEVILNQTTDLEKFLQELVHLTKLRTLSIAMSADFEWPETEDVVRLLGTLMATHNIPHLRIKMETRELLSLESWCPANSAVLRKICIHGYYIQKVPSWMGLLVNLRGLDLSMYCTGAEDVAILGQIPALAFLKLQTWYGRNGRILIHGFRSLKYFNLMLRNCGTAVEFEEGSMLRLEHLKLRIYSHKMECMNNSSDFGMEHLSALTKVDLVLLHGGGNTNDIVHKIERSIETVVGKLPNRPTLSLHHYWKPYCEHFKEAIENEFSNLVSGILDDPDSKEYYPEIMFSTLGPYLGQLVQEIRPDARSFSSIMEEAYASEEANFFALTPLSSELDHLQLSLAVTQDNHDVKARTKKARVSGASNARATDGTYGSLLRN